MNLNKVILIGRLTADPEYRTTQSGQDVTNLRMATNRVWSDPSGNRQEMTEFHSIVTWGRLAQIANEYLNKGSLVMIEGRLQTRSWEAQTGEKRYRTEIVAENLQLGPRSASQSTHSKGEFKKPAAFSESEKKNEMQDKAPVEEDIPIINTDEDTANVTEEEVDLTKIPF